MITSPLPQEIIKYLIVSGAKFKYKSYNHKKAVEEIKEIESKNGTVPYKANNMFQLQHSCWSIPQEIKDKHEVWRYGKLWQAHFDKNGDVQKIYVGAMFRYKKAFWHSEIGITIKPIIFKSDDKYDLISKGLAIEDVLK